MMVSQQLLQKFVTGQVDEQEAALCEDFLARQDSATFELDTDLEKGDTIIRSLRNAGLNSVESEMGQDEYSEITAEIEGQLQRRLETEDIAKFLRPAQSEDEIGRIANFRVLEKIGSGGMGIVFRVEEAETGRECALKLMNPLLASNPKAAERFQREVRSAASLEHARIVPIGEMGVDLGIPYFTMSLLRGQSLASILNRGESLANERVCRYAGQIAEALDYAGQKGILHRDIKPDNIWIDENDSVVILDFGLARGLDESAGLTKTGDVLGTPQYMAPEQVTGGKIDARADLFSLGAVLFEMITGQSKFAAQNVYSTMMAITQQEVAAKELLDHQCPASLARLVCRLLEKDPKNRPRDAGEVLAEIRKIQTELSTIDAKSTPEFESKKSKVNRATGIAFLAGVATAMLAIFLGIVIFQSTDKGVLVVEAEEGVQLTTGKDEVQIRLIDTKKVYTVRIGENKLPSGAYELVIAEEGSDLTFSTDRFAIRRGKKRLVTVTARKHSNPAAGNRKAGDSTPLGALPKRVRGIVISADSKAPFYLLINCGADDGFKIGDEIDVFRDNKFICRAMVTNAEPNRMVAKPTDGGKNAVRKGDQVSSVLDKKQSNNDQLGKPQSGKAGHGLPAIGGGANPSGSEDPANHLGNLMHRKALPILKTLGLKAGQSLGESSLVGNPTADDSMDSYTVETRYHRSRINDMELDQDHQWLAVAGDDAVVRIWDWDFSSSIESPSDHFESVKGRAGIGPRSPFDKKLLHILPCRFPVQSISWSPNGNILAAVCTSIDNQRGFVLIWRINEKKAELIEQINGVASDICWAPNGREIAVRIQKNIVFFDLGKNKLKGKPNHGMQGRFTKRAWSTEGWFAVSVPSSRPKSDSESSKNAIRDINIWDLKAGKVHHSIPAAQSGGFFVDAKGQTMLAYLGFSDDLKDLRVPVKIVGKDLIREVATKMLTPNSRLQFSPSLNGFLAIEPKQWQSYQTDMKVLGFRGQYFGDDQHHEWPYEAFEYENARLNREHLPIVADFRWNFSTDRDHGLTGDEGKMDSNTIVIAVSQKTESGLYKLSMRYRSEPDAKEGEEEFHVTVNLTSLSDGKTIRVFEGKFQEKNLPSPEQFRVSPNGQQIAWVHLKMLEDSDNSKWQNEISVIDLRTKQTWTKQFPPGRAQLARPAWSRDSQHILVGDQYRTTRYIVVKPGDSDFENTITKGANHRGVVVANNNDRLIFGVQNPKWFAWSHRDDSVAIHDMAKGTMVRKIQADRTTLVSSSSTRSLQTRLVGFDWLESSQRMLLAVTSNHFRGKVFVQAFDLSTPEPTKISEIAIQADPASSRNPMSKIKIWCDQEDPNMATFVNLGSPAVQSKTSQVSYLRLDLKSQSIKAKSFPGTLPPITEVQSLDGRLLVGKTDDEWFRIDTHEGGVKRIPTPSDSIRGRWNQFSTAGPENWLSWNNRQTSFRNEKFEPQATFLLSDEVPANGYQNGGWVTNNGSLFLFDSSLRDQLRYLVVKDQSLSLMRPDPKSSNPLLHPKKELPAELRGGK